jgi:hypothetical protein
MSITDISITGGNQGYNRYSDQAAYNRGSYSRPDSYIDNLGGSSSNQQYNPHYPYNYGGRAQRPRQASRINSEFGNGASTSNFYPQQSYQRSNDNMTAGSGSNNTDQWGNTTDPSSVNSSMDRLQQQLQNPPKPEISKPAEMSGLNGFEPGPQLDASFRDPSAPTPPPHKDQPAYVNGANGVNGQGEAPPPPPPTKDSVPSRPTLKKGGSEKRASWLKKRFSRD